MKTFGRKSIGIRGQHGSALLVALLVAAILLPMVYASMYMMSVQQRTVSVSQDWNAAMPVIEAGIEEAFAHLNTDCFSNAVNNGDVDWSRHGWTKSGDTFKQERRTFDNGAYYEVYIVTNGNGASEKSPDIVCLGSAPTRYGLRIYTNQYTSLALKPQFAQIQSKTSTGEIDRGTNAAVMRQVRVKATRWTWTDFGLLSDGDMVFKGKSTLMSFNSLDSSNSWFGSFNTNYAGDSSSVGSIQGNIELGSSTEIFGEGEISPEGEFTVGTHAKVGSEAWVTNETTTGIEPGSVEDDLNMDMPKVDLPADWASWQSLSPCNCVKTYTNPVVDGKWLLNQTNYPSSPPPGGIVVTNDNGTRYSFVYDSSPPPYQTNLVTNAVFNFSLVPTNPVPGDLSTNAASWKETLATTLNSPAPDPTNYISPPGIVVMLTSTNYETTNSPALPAACYQGSLTNLGERRVTGGGRSYFTTNWGYAHIFKKRYQVSSNEYTWTTNQYLYKDETYNYFGPQTNSTVVTESYLYAPDPGNWQITGDLELKSDLMLISGHTRIFISKGQLKISGNGAIRIAPDASLQVYVDGDVDISGNGIANESGKAINLQIYGTENCENVSFSGNTVYIGTLLAPQALFKGNGGGNNESGMIIGSVAAGEMALVGDWLIGQDLGLAQLMPPQYFVASSWAEETAGK